MAYINFLGIVSRVELTAFVANPVAGLRGSHSCAASHLIACCGASGALGSLLAEALDGGELVHELLWHPFRPPLFHGPEKVRSLAMLLNDAKSMRFRSDAIARDAWSAAEIAKA
jgi:hypothetical protein